MNRIMICAALVYVMFSIVAPAQTSRKHFAQQSTFSKYRMLTAIAQQWVAEENQSDADETATQNGESTDDTAGEDDNPSEYYLFSCKVDYPDDLPWSSAEKSSKKLTNLAFVTATWRSDFKDMGILGSDMEAEISRFEKQTISDWEVHGWRGSVVLDRQIERFQHKLNRMRATKKNWPEFEMDDGCGAGDIDVKIAINPPSGQLFVISKFYFMLCKAQNIDPMNLTKCDRWNELHGSVSPLAGDYYYLAKWSDGSIRCGQLGVNEAADKDKDLIIAKLQKDACLIK